jgi:hypothetical protein
LALYDNDPTGLIAKQFGAALAAGGAMLANSAMASGSGLNNAMAAFNNAGGFNNSGGFNGPGLPNNLATFINTANPSAFSQAPMVAGTPAAFAPPSRMTPPPMSMPTVFMPPGAQNAFAAPPAMAPMTRAELNNRAGSIRPVPPLSVPPSYLSGPSYGVPPYAPGPNASSPSYPAPGVSAPAYPSPNAWSASPAPGVAPPYGQMAPGGASVRADEIGALNRAAAQATARRDFDEAISKLQDARHLAPNDQIIGRNLGLAFGNAANVAVQEGQFDRALQYYKNALEVLKTGSDKSAYDQILSDYQTMLKKQSSSH